MKPLVLLVNIVKSETFQAHKETACIEKSSEQSSTREEEGRSRDTETKAGGETGTFTFTFIVYK